MKNWDSDSYSLHFRQTSVPSTPYIFKSGSILWSFLVLHADFSSSQGWFQLISICSISIAVLRTLYQLYYLSGPFNPTPPTFNFYSLWIKLIWRELQLACIEMSVEMSFRGNLFSNLHSFYFLTFTSSSTCFCTQVSVLWLEQRTCVLLPPLHSRQRTIWKTAFHDCPA